MIKKELIFYSDSVPLAGDLYLPDETSAEIRRGVVILLSGFWGTKGTSLADEFGEYGNQLCKAGYAIFRYDHPGFGKSGGERGRIVPLQQVEGIKDAITFLQQQPEINSDKIGLLGASLGGGHAVYVAAVDKRIKCVAIVSAVADGEAFLRYERRGWEWQAFLKRLEDDRVSRVLTGKSEYVSPYKEMMVETPDEEKKQTAQLRYKNAGSDRISLYSGECIINYKPIDFVDKVQIPILVVHAKKDAVVPLERTVEMYSRAHEPKELLLVDCGHYGAFIPSTEMELSTSTVVQWFLKHMPAL